MERAQLASKYVGRPSVVIATARDARVRIPVSRCPISGRERQTALRTFPFLCTAAADDVVALKRVESRRRSGPRIPYRRQCIAADHQGAAVSDAAGVTDDLPSKAQPGGRASEITDCRRAR